VQTKAELDLVVGQSLIQTGVLGILDHLTRLLQRWNKQAEADQAHVRKLRVALTVLRPHISFLVEEHVFLFQLPNNEESVTDILVRRTLKRIDDTVHDLADLVYEQHDTFLEYFRGVRKVPDIAEAKYGNELLAGQHRVDVASFFNIFSDDFRAGFTEAKCQ
jgi:hypothetical protein